VAVLEGEPTAVAGAVAAAAQRKQAAGRATHQLRHGDPADRQTVVATRATHDGRRPARPAAAGPSTPALPRQIQ